MTKTVLMSSLLAITTPGCVCIQGDPTHETPKIIEVEEPEAFQENRGPNPQKESPPLANARRLQNLGNKS